MAQSFTPGPWLMVGTQDEGEPSGRYVQWVIDPHVAEVSYTNDAGRANARLIAASPNMLAALQNIQSALNTGHNIDEARGWVSEAIKLATEAS